MNRRTLLIAAILVGLPLLAAAALYLVVSPEKLKPVVEAQMSAALARTVRIGEFSFRMLPLSLEATNLTVSDDPAFSAKPFLSAERVHIRPALLPLFGGKVEVENLDVEEPRVELIQNAAKKWNYESIGGQTSASNGGQTSLTLGRLELSNATLGVTQSGSPRTEYRRLGLALKDYAANRPFTLAVSATTEQGATMRAAGQVEASKERTVLKDVEFLLANLKGKVNGEMVGESLKFRVEIPSSPVADVAPLFLPKGTNVKGQVAAQIEATGTVAKPLLQGKITVDGFEVSGGDIKQPVRTAKLLLELTPERISLMPTEIVSGSTKMQALGVVSNYATRPLIDVTLLAPNAQIPELLAIARTYGVAGVEGIQSSGEMRLQVRAHGALSGGAPLEMSGTGALRNAVLELPSLTKPLNVRGTDFRFAANSAQLSNIDAQIGSTNATGSLEVANFKRPVLNFDLAANKVVLAELRALTKPGPAGAAPQLTANGNLRLGELDLENVVLRQLTAQANYRDGHLVLNPLRASLYGGTHAGSMDIDLRPNPPQYALDSRLERIESAELMAAATAVKGIVSGPLSANLQLRFSPAEPVAMARSLNGKLSLNMAQGKIAGFNMTNELAGVAKFLGFNASPEKYTQILGLAGDLSLVNGVASSENLKLDLADLSATMTGSLNLTDQTLNLKVLSILTKRFTEQVGGSRVGGFLTAALTNSNGNLMIPASITGTFARPLMAPDPGAMAKLKLQSFNPKDPKQAIDSVNSVIDLFRKRK